MAVCRQSIEVLGFVSSCSFFTPSWLNPDPSLVCPAGLGRTNFPGSLRPHSFPASTPSRLLKRSSGVSLRGPHSLKALSLVSSCGYWQLEVRGSVARDRGATLYCSPIHCRPSACPRIGPPQRWNAHCSGKSVSEHMPRERLPVSIPCSSGVPAQPFGKQGRRVSCLASLDKKAVWFPCHPILVNLLRSLWRTPELGHELAGCAELLGVHSPQQGSSRGCSLR